VQEIRWTSFYIAGIFGENYRLYWTDIYVDQENG